MLSTGNWQKCSRCHFFLPHLSWLLSHLTSCWCVCVFGGVQGIFRGNEKFFNFYERQRPGDIEPSTGQSDVLLSWGVANLRNVFHHLGILASTFKGCAFECVRMHAHASEATGKPLVSVQVKDCGIWRAAKYCSLWHQSCRQGLSRE